MGAGNSKNKAEIVAGARRIKASMATLCRKFVEIAEAVHELHPKAEPETIERLLHVETGLAPEDIRIFVAVSKIAGSLNMSDEDSAMPVHVASPETLRLLADSSEEVRAEAIRMIGAGHPVGSSRLAQIESFLGWSRSGDERTAADRRATCLLATAARNAPAAIRAFEAEADRFIARLDEFFLRHLPWPEEEGDLIVSSAYVAAHHEVSELAASLLSEFERVLGGAESLEAAALLDPEAKLVARSHEALRRFSSGRFGHRGGFSFDASADAMFSTELSDAVRYLGTQHPEELEPLVTHTRPPERLHVLELGAGAGGMAIGLMSAGFVHDCLYEINNKRLTTLRKNWPTWPVIKADIAKLAERQLERYRGIDLLAGSLPSAPVSRKKKKTDKTAKAYLVPSLVRAVKIVQPRAFMFETPASFAYEQHLEHLAEMEAQLTCLGYDVDTHEIATRDYGLPQERTRLIIVGIRKGEAGTFLAPVPERTLERSVADVLGPLVIQYEAMPDPTQSVVAQKAQSRYNQWAGYWREKHSKSFLSTIPVSSKETRPSHLDPFERQGSRCVVLCRRPDTSRRLRGLPRKARCSAGQIFQAPADIGADRRSARISGRMDLPCRRRRQRGHGGRSFAPSPCKGCRSQDLFGADGHSVRPRRGPGGAHYRGGHDRKAASPPSAQEEMADWSLLRKRRAFRAS
ncbi:DNA cytosine methyltransferase [Ensifer adhaerens]